MTQLPFVGRPVLAALIVAALFAQSVAAPSQPAAAPPSTKLESVLVRAVTPPKGIEGGRIIDVLIDGNGQVHAYVVEFGGFLGIGTRKIAVELAAFRFEGPKIFVDVAGDELQAAREFTAGETLFILRSPTQLRD